uniref:Uncharacterized protein n=1 Tax=Nicotiana tabacum TaxID=4097 RepID=A0A1S4CJX7_TOBAC|nr:PREDICTED: uncharacterized protein LOC107819854 [Nicotiana tabacum]
MFSKTNLFLCVSLAILLIVISSQADAREMSKAPATITQAMKMGAGINGVGKGVGKAVGKAVGKVAGKACKICSCKYKICSKCPKCHD